MGFDPLPCMRMEREMERGAEQKQPAECRAGKAWYLWLNRLCIGKKVGGGWIEVQHGL